jgi:TRAP transporter TAXI family solute receptor
MKKILSTLLLVLSITACGLVVKATAADVYIKIATGNTGGVYYPVGVALSQLFSKNIPNVVSSAMSTGGSVDNITLLRSDEAQLATMMETVTEWAYNGEDVFKGKAYKDMRAITSLWPNLNHLVVHNSIKNAEDLKGQRFVVGAARSGTETDAHAILAGLGLYYRDEYGDKKNITPVWISYTETVEAMKNRLVAGGVFNAYPPGAAISDLLADGNFHILHITDEQIARIHAAQPLYSAYTVPRGTYPNQPEDVQITGYPNLLLGTTAMSDEIAYLVTRNIFENTEYLTAAHSAASLITLENALKGINVPFHAGAEKYYREKGVWPK